MAKASKKFSTGEALRFGWKTMKENYPFFLLLFGLNLGIIISRWLIEAQLQKNDIFLHVVLTIGYFLLNSVLSIGTINAMLLLVKGKKPGFSSLFDYTPGIFFSYIIASLLNGIIILLGFILLIIPGIIWSVKFQYFSYILLEKKTGPVEALKKSSGVTRGSIWSLFIFNFTLGLINLLGVLCLLVGLFATIPTTMIASAYIYKKLSAK